MNPISITNKTPRKNNSALSAFDDVICTTQTVLWWEFQELIDLHPATCENNVSSLIACL